MMTKTLLNKEACNLTLKRLVCQLHERHHPWSQSVIVGLQPRGIALARLLANALEADYQTEPIAVGEMDITFHRDDFRRRDEPLAANPNNMDLLIEGKRVIFVDDVLYTGRSIRAALDAIQPYGRPSLIELCVLIDRRFSRELPIQPTYTGQR
ncbi:MAG: bifunctional pyr operon transcriptional regulator/uracil phosphoribosyltransferase PyrR, partial [Schleiferiaceae bacterium]|nr:bifunctional pyr operon transcriptional regulator/uracil phosphoribosyltransferase PyrR [Schleiferiaceae bacterium]